MLTVAACEQYSAGLQTRACVGQHLCANTPTGGPALRAKGPALVCEGLANRRAGQHDGVWHHGWTLQPCDAAAASLPCVSKLNELTGCKFSVA